MTTRAAQRSEEQRFRPKGGKTTQKRLDNGLYWDQAWSLVEGCTPVSEGCRHCWAANLAWMRRNHPNPKVAAANRGLAECAVPRSNVWDRSFATPSQFNGTVRVREDLLALPTRTKKPTVWSIWTDLFHEAVPETFIRKVFLVAAQCSQHTFLILTKRAARMCHVVNGLRMQWDEAAAWPLKNVWLGVTAENQEMADRRIPWLMRTHAAYRFVSCEPLLERIHLRSWPEMFGPVPGLTNWATFAWPDWVPEKLRWEISGYWSADLIRGPVGGYNNQFQGKWVGGPAFGAVVGVGRTWTVGKSVVSRHDPRAEKVGRFIPKSGNVGYVATDEGEAIHCAFGARPDYLCKFDPASPPLFGGRLPVDHRTERLINWIICGPETGPFRRPFKPEWARSLLADCRDEPGPGVRQPAAIPFFDKSVNNPLSRDLPWPASTKAVFACRQNPEAASE